MIRSARLIFRPLVAAMLAVAVFASPVMSAEACARTCAVRHDDGSFGDVPFGMAGASVEDKCCPGKDAQRRSHDRPSQSSSSDDCGQCAATCCRPVTTINDRRVSISFEAPALAVEPSPVAARDFDGQRFIFHPPRA